ncbi:copper resistance CopC family protein [Corynebacterium freneyi]|uniref:copper resistance CopC family protein n=1 Tax=Corynebacterium freneyi TaxID=134034 RepID=UPI001EF2AE14|nr:copper resistance protein CopC [Corynebacterium freneyi]MCG7439648.1 copper resistance protein CopC [Corynebacterium freneyi]
MPVHMRKGFIGRSAIAATLATGLAFAPALGGADTAPVAHAHDSVIASTPADGQNLDEFPRRIEMTFSGVPRDSFNTVAVSNADTKEVLLTEQPELDGQVISFDVPESLDPGPGAYIVGFQITSSDGHSTRGKLSFSVGDHQVDAGGGSDLEEDSGVPTWAWIAGGGLVAVILAVVAGVAVVNRKAD